MPESLHSGDEGYTLVTNKKGTKRKSKRNSNSCSSDDQSATAKKAAVNQLQPVVLEATGDKHLSTYSPIAIDRCLRKSIGLYESCKPIRNGKLIIKCKSINQINTLLNLKCLSDTQSSIPIRSSMVKPIGAKGVVYVPYNISNEEMLESLQHYHVTAVKRFKIKNETGSNTTYAESKTVFIQFNSSELPNFIQIG